MMITRSRIAATLTLWCAAALVPALAGPAAAAGGVAYSFGISQYGQLGRGLVTNTRQLPAPITALSNTSQVAAGREHGLALAGGTVYGWGWNMYGAVGDGTTTNRSVPVAVSGLCAGSSVTQIATGHYHSLALCSNGRAYAWGQNTYGELGDATTTQRNSPVAVANLTTAVELAGGQYSSYARLANGSVWAWGYNTDGELGTGTTTRSTVPVPVTGLPANIVQIIAGRNHALARSSTGDLYAWGGNVDGQVGDGTTTNRTRAVLILTGVKQVGAGGFHSLAAKTDGTLWTWGYNATGQLGDNTTVAKSSPVQITALTGVASVSGGRDDSAAIRSDGTVWMWGKNGSGQLGDGKTVNRRTPYQVSGLTGVTAVGLGNDYTLVLAN